jgi:glycogen operon protein
VNFAVASRHATSVTLLVSLPGDEESVREFPLDLRRHTTGDVWHALLTGLDTKLRYAYRMGRDAGSEPKLHRFDPRQELLDPYARALTSGRPWGAPAGEGGASPRRCTLPSEEFDWGDDALFRIPYAEAVVYEVHVRGFTRHASSKVSRPGTFAGLVEKIPYLQELGVNVVELLPVWEFEETELDRVDPITGKPLLDFWGYNPISFFAPKAAYASGSGDGDQVREFKEMVKSLHAAGIAVVLDVVLNHTGEGDARGPTHSWRGIDDAIYYLLDPETGAYRDYTGCGNTLNSNHPRVRDLIIDALRHWVAEMHVDGFRFDLASVLYRGEDGSVLPNPPIIEQIAEDPILRHTALIAEAWDAAGVYQVGRFTSRGRWAEWNGRFRDDLRRFVKSDPGMVSALATRLVGSPDLYQTSGRLPYHSINFITSHDGFTLADLVAYEQKHNEANGEDNRDGENHNLSWNCGVEGPTGDAAILALRARQRRNFMLTLLVSQGVPMLSGGDEVGRTQQGNNNAYCQDSELSWTPWDQATADDAFLAFVRRLLALRAAQPVLRRRTFLIGRRAGAVDVLWLRPEGGEMTDADWRDPARRAIGVLLDGGAIPETGLHGEPVIGDTLLLLLNAGRDDVTFALPDPSGHWSEQVNTVSPDAPLAAAPSGPGVVLPAHSSAVFLQERARQA